MISQQMQEIARQYMDALGTPVSEKVKNLMISGSYLTLTELRTEPKTYSKPWPYFLDACATEFLRKMPGLPTGIDLGAAAVSTFYECEASCYRTNQRAKRWLNWRNHGFVGSSSELRLHEFIEAVRSEVKSLLGPIPSSIPIRFGKGATFHDRASLTTIPDKLSSVPAFTPSASAYETYVYESAWGRSLLRGKRASAKELVQGNRFTSVLKDSSKDRGICIEPSGNIALQLGVARTLRYRLFVFAGIDLSNGQRLHHRLARKGSIDGSLVTMDLSNASDTIAKVIVELFLPRNWFQLLNDLRSHKTLLNGRWINLEKFSSMGNGFTFELETIIFLCIARVIARRRGASVVDCKVYGDDIIVPSSISVDVAAALSCFGMSVNSRKTFHDGPFRESCGGDFFNGHWVRPMYAKKDPTNPAEWISLANQIRATHHRDGVWHLPKMANVWTKVLAQLPTEIRAIRGPAELGDVVITDHESTWQIKTRQCRRYIKTYQPIAERVKLAHFDPETQLASLLYGVPSTGAGVRNGVSGYRKKWLSLP